jgi:hypothetical protein
MTDEAAMAHAMSIPLPVEEDDELEEWLDDPKDPAAKAGNVSA